MSAQCEIVGAQANGGELGVFERYLTLWVFLCIGAGIDLGHLFPTAFQAVGHMEIARINLPVALLIWLMIIPMLLAAQAWRRWLLRCGPGTLESARSHACTRRRWRRCSQP